MTNATGKSNKQPHQTHHDHFMKDFDHDDYKGHGKPAEPAVCRECGAVFHKGRWQWATRPEGAHEVLCPACHRIHDKHPGGYLTLSGAFLASHHDEILHLARHTETREKAEHPLERIMSLEKEDGSLRITTTTMRMARAIGDALHHAYQGDLDYQYTDENNILRVSWKR
jgi:hypothetical protein